MTRFQKISLPKRLNHSLLIPCFATLLLLSGCALQQVDLQQAENLPPGKESSPAPAQSKPPKAPPVVQRAVSEKELQKIEAKDPDLHVRRSIEILSRLNKKDREYIQADMKNKRPLSVPKDFSAYRDWSPLPDALSGLDKIPKCILVVKDIPFLGWYAHGKRVGDTYICIGKMKHWTKRGIYRIDEKDPHHMSDYPNAYGAPSLMPFAMRIYERVWIHAGDIIGPRCSHGCINVPLSCADKLYSWADIGTLVIVTESLEDLGRDMRAGIPSRKPAAQPAGTKPKGAAGKSGL